MVIASGIFSEADSRSWVYIRIIIKHTWKKFFHLVGLARDNVFPPTGLWKPTLQRTLRINSHKPNGHSFTRTTHITPHRRGSKKKYQCDEDQHANGGFVNHW